MGADDYEEYQHLGWSSDGAWLVEEYEYVCHACKLMTPARFVLFVDGLDLEDISSIKDELEYTRALRVWGEDEQPHDFYPEVTAHLHTLLTGQLTLILTVTGGERRVE